MAEFNGRREKNVSLYRFLYFNYGVFAGLFKRTDVHLAIVQSSETKKGGKTYFLAKCSLESIQFTKLVNMNHTRNMHLKVENIFLVRQEKKKPMKWNGAHNTISDESNLEIVIKETGQIIVIAGECQWLGHFGRFSASVRELSFKSIL